MFYQRDKHRQTEGIDENIGRSRFIADKAGRILHTRFNCHINALGKNNSVRPGILNRLSYGLSSLLVKVGDDNRNTFFRKELCGDVTHTRPTPDNHGNFSCEPHAVHAVGPQCRSQSNGTKEPRGASSCLVTQLVVATQVVHNNGGTKVQSQKPLTT